MQATIYLVIAAILWGLNFHYIKFMLNESSYFEAGFWRYAFSTLAMFLISLGALKHWVSSKISIKGVLFVGVIGLLGFNLAIYIGMQYTSALNASLIMSLNPITTILLSALILKTEAKWYHFFGAILSMFGVLSLLTEGQVFNLQHFQFNNGDLLIFVGNVVFAFYHIGVKQYKGDAPNLQFTGYTNLISMFGFLIIMSISSSEVSINYSINYWYWTIIVGILGTAISFLLWNKGVSKLGADKAGIFMNIVPLATAISSLFFGLEIQAYHIYSGFIIIIGIIFTQFFSYYFKNK